MNSSFPTNDEDNASVFSHSSRISFEIDPCLVLEEISRQNHYSPDDGSVDSEIEEQMDTALIDGLLDKEISSKGCITYVSSNLSLSSWLEDETPQSNLPFSTLTSKKCSIIGMFDKLIVEKPRTLSRVRSYSPTSNKHNAFHKRGSALSSHSELFGAREAIKENVDMGRNHDATFEGENVTQQKPLCYRRHSAAVFTLRDDTPEMNLQKNDSQRRSAVLQLRDTSKSVRTNFTSIIKDLKTSHIDLVNNKSVKE